MIIFLPLRRVFPALRRTPAEAGRTLGKALYLKVTEISKSGTQYEQASLCAAFVWCGDPDSGFCGPRGRFARNALR
jgi:hypothetical protein